MALQSVFLASMSQRFIALYLPVSEIKILRYIAIWCQRFTPFVCVEHDISPEILESQKLRRGLILEITGTGRLHRSEDRLGGTIVGELQKRNIPVSAAFACSVGAAWAMSRYSHNTLTIHGAEPINKLVSSYPISSLRLSQDEVASLNEVGIFSLSDIFSVPIKQLAVRFGINVVKRIDQLTGAIHEPLRIVKINEQLSSNLRLDYYITETEALKRVLLHLLDDLLQKLGKKGSKASAFHLRFSTEKGSIITRNVSLYLASRNIRHISSILQPTLDSITISEPIVAASITALHIRPLDKDQERFESFDSLQKASPDDERAYGELINVFTARLGANQIRKALLKESYIPERSFELVQIDKFTPQSSSHFIADRPSLLLSPPEPAQAIAMLPDKPPSWLQWRGKKLKLLKGSGPERILEEWWREGLPKALSGRDYFKVQDETGRWLWVFRESETLNWFVHGLWA